MAGQPLDKLKDARYHTIAVTDEWAAFVQTMMDAASNAAASRVRDSAQRKRAASPTSTS